jgi:uncharacterized protein
VSDSGAQPAFDDAARTSTRRKLLHYETEHGIGVHRLADRISKANKRNPEIPIKTLQRFLAGHFRTSDMYVGFFQQFAKDLPEPGPDPIGVLGKAMATFLNAKGSKDFAGTFSSSMSGGTGADSVHYQSTWLVTADEKFCRVVERTESDPLIVCDGLLIGQERTAVVALQDRTTKALRQYQIATDGDGYNAVGTEAVFKPGSDNPIRTLSGRIGVYRAAINLSGPISAVEWNDRSRRRMGRSDVPLQRRGRLLDKLADAFRRQPVDATRTAATEQPHLSDDKGDNIFRVAHVIRNAGEREGPVRNDPPEAALLTAAERSDEPELRRLVESGADVNEIDPATGLTALHLATGRNDIDAVRFLVEHGAAFVPDKFGRMPSTIAAESEVSEELCDYIAEAEARAEGVKRPLCPARSDLAQGTMHEDGTRSVIWLHPF